MAILLLIFFQKSVNVESPYNLLLGLTYKNTNISLIDTPGHVDFTIEVERALRVMDSAVAIIDGVAGVQAQTETVWRQAARHLLPVISFVNKMDREGADFLKSMNSVRSALNANVIAIQCVIGNGTKVVDLVENQVFDWSGNVIGNVSDLEKIEITESDQESIRNARDSFIEKLIDIDDTLMNEWIESGLEFGSIPSCQLKDAVRRATIGRKMVPVLRGSALKDHGVISLMNAMIDYLPNPLERGNLSGTNRNGDLISLPIQLNGPLIAFAFKVTHDPFLGALVFVRIFSGCMHLDSIKGSLYNLSKQVKDRPQKLLKIYADEQQEINIAQVGSVVALSGLKETMTGDSLTLVKDRDGIVLQGVEIPEAVFSASIEPENRKVGLELEPILKILQREDPSLRVSNDLETGEIVISGMGELHLEIIYNRLINEFRLDVQMNKPRVAFRETVTECAQEQFTFDKVLAGKKFFATLTIRISPMEHNQSGIQILTDIDQELVSTLPKNWSEKEHAIHNAFRSALGRGALCGFPVDHVRVELVLDSNESIGSIDGSDIPSLNACAAHAVRNLLVKASPRILEPMMKVDILVSRLYAGSVMADIASSRRRGRVDSVSMESGNIEHNQDDNLRQLISATVPLQGLLGYSNVLRSTTKGNASFSMTFINYEIVPKSIQDRILEEY